MSPSLPPCKNKNIHLYSLVGKVLKLDLRESDVSLVEVRGLASQEVAELFEGGVEWNLVDGAR